MIRFEGRNEVDLDRPYICVCERVKKEEEEGGEREREREKGIILTDPSDLLTGGDQEIKRLCANRYLSS